MKFAWGRACIDEAHQANNEDVLIFKNSNTHVRKWFLTGTPFVSTWNFSGFNGRELHSEFIINWLNHPWRFFLLFIRPCPMPLRLVNSGIYDTALRLA